MTRAADIAIFQTLQKKKKKKNWNKTSNLKMGIV